MQLTDINARTLCGNSRSSVESLIEALLRMQNAPSWERPIFFYLGLGKTGQPPMDALDILSLCDTIRVLRSPVHTFALGLLSGLEPLLLASGQTGHRYVLPHAMVAVGAVANVSLPLPNGVVGLRPNPREPSLQHQGQDWLQLQVEGLTRELGLSPHFWSHPRILGADQIIQAGLADTLLPARTPNKTIIPQEHPLHHEC